MVLLIYIKFSISDSYAVVAAGGYFQPENLKGEPL